MDPYEAGAAAGVAVGFLVFYFVFLFLMVALSIAQYVLSSLGTYQIAKRRGIHNPWLAWLPVGTSWILGSISDHFQHVAKGKTRKFRIVLMILEIAMYLWIVLYYAAFIGAAFSVAAAGGDGATASSALGLVGTLFLMVFLLMAVAVTYSVFAYLAYYDLFKSCKPDNAVLFLVLGIFVNVTLPFFIFACRKADEGMPPRIRAIEG